MKILLFIAVSLSLASMEAKPESDVPALTAPAVHTAKQVCEDVRDAECPAEEEIVRAVVVNEGHGSDQLELLRNHLDGMAQSLRETEKSVTEMARQRDAARAEVARHQQEQAEAMRGMAKLREELKAARSEGAEWKRMASTLEDQVGAGAMAKAEMQKFRDELHGAMREFQAMKEDFGKAREELQDPIERKALKKSVADLQATQKDLTHDVELAVKAKNQMAQSVETLKAALHETEGKVRDQLTEMKEVGRALVEARAGRTKALAEVEALRQQAAVEREQRIKVSTERDELRRGLEEQSKLAQAADKEAEASRKRMATLEQEQERTGRESAELQRHVHKLEAEVNGKEQELADAVKAAETATGARAAMEESLAEARSGLALQEKTLAGLNAEMKKVTESLKQAEEDKRKANDEVTMIRSGLSEVNGKLVLVTKAKSGLQDLLLKKAAEVRELKVALRNAEARKAHEEQSQDETPAQMANAPQE